jgi:hypothetical protein
MSGVTVSLSGFENSLYNTVSDGFYSFLITTNSYSVTPAYPYSSFSPANKLFSNTQSAALNQDFYRINSSPTFSAGVTNYQNALTTQTFTFSAVYKDSENDGPAAGSMKVSIFKDGVFISKLPLTYSGNDFISGVVCVSAGAIFGTAGRYTYSFTGSDIWGYTANYTDNGSGLYFDVSDVPVCSFCNTSPQALDGHEIVSSKVTLSWAAVDALNAPIKFSLFFSQPCDNVIHFRSPPDRAVASLGCIYTGSNTSYTFYNMTPGKYYYWQVQADNGRGTLALSPLWSFKTSDLGINSVLNYPNPFKAGRENTAIVFNASSSESADFYVFSEFGKNIFHATISVFPGTNSYEYNGKDNGGNVLFNGTYPYIVNVDGKRLKNSLLVVK